MHFSITQGKRGRQHITEHFNLALFVSLAAEFQGFCRDLHDEAAIVIADSLAPGNDEQIPVVLNALVRARKLDQGNAGPGNLGNDFAILGMTLWPDIRARYPTVGRRWNTVLEDLNTVRNAVAHSDSVKLAEVRRDHSLTLRTFRRWRSTLGVAAGGIDNVVGAYLRDVTGKPSWT